MHCALSFSIKGGFDVINMVLLEKPAVFTVSKWTRCSPFCACSFGVTTILAKMIDQGIVPQDKKSLYLWTLVMVIVILLGVVGRIILSSSSSLTTTMIKELRNDMFSKVQDFSHVEYEKIGVSSLVTRITNDAFILMQFAEMSLRLGVITPLMMVFSASGF